MDLPVAPQYQNLIQEARSRIAGGFPVSFVGMPQSGIDHLFGLLRIDEVLTKKYSVVPIIHDGSVNQNDPLVTPDAVCHPREGGDPFLFLIYTNLSHPLSIPFCEQLLKLRFTHGVQVNWIICATYSVLSMKNPTVIQVLHGHISPLLPHSLESFKVVFDNFCSRLGKIPPVYLKKTFTLSGGCPGIAKALFLYVKQNGTLDGVESDQNLRARMKTIAEELSPLEKVSLRGPKGRGNLAQSNLSRFGFIKNDKIFSPLFASFLQQEYPLAEIDLTAQQKEILALLKDKQIGSVSRDEIAQALWKKNWQEKYSDWAIDQCIYALRKTISKLKLPYKIETKKNEGYRLTNKND